MPRSVSLLLPAWARIERAFARDVSLIIHGPRFAGKSGLLRAIGTDYAPARQAKCVFIELAAYRALNGTLDYRKLFTEMKAQLHLKNGIACDDYLSFEDALQRTVAKLPARLIFLVRLSSHLLDVEEECIFLTALHSCLASEFLSSEAKLLAVAVDDFSLWNHERYAKVSSEMYRFERLYLQPLTQDEICAVIGSLSAAQEAPLPPSERDEWGRLVAAATGGHVGLTLEAIEFISELGWRLPARAEGALLERLSQSSILSALQLAIQEEPAGLAQTALEFRQPKFPMELRSSRLLLLRRLGILQPQKMQELILCPGVVRQMVEAIQATGDEKSGRLGKVIREAGPAVFEQGNVPLTGDDLVIVHLSDLHIGSEYGFAYQDRHGKAFNQGLPSFLETLRSDLAGMGLLDRIDALVVSGDFVWRGTAPEFRVARDVLDDLVLELHLEGRLVICPGNHDITWTQGAEDRGGDPEVVKRDAFDDFAEHLGHSFRDHGVCCTTVGSRSGKSRVHLLCFDSNVVESEQAAGIGYISPEALNRADQLLQEKKRDDGEDMRAHVWMVLHHHIFPATPIRLEDARSAHLTIMANAPEVLAWARRHNVETILHGHEHQPSITIARSWPIDSMGKEFVPILAISAGSACVKRQHLGPFGRNQYFVMYQRAGDIIVRSRCLGDQGFAFVAHNDIVI